MDFLRKPLLLACLAGIPFAAAMPPTPPDLCFAAGTVTYRLSAKASANDYRVAIDNDAAEPDLRIRLVDRVEAADFALTDDAGAMIGSACKTAGLVKSAHVVPRGEPADITVALSRQGSAGDFSLYVHSGRVSHLDAAALFALIRSELAAAQDHELEGAPDRLARVR